MKYISKVRFINYKLFVDKTVEFQPGMNIIKGPSERGKSTVLKGIRKCLINDPSDDYTKFLTWGAKRGAKVELNVWIVDTDTKTETRIERVMGSKTNEYHIYYEDGSVSDYIGFGVSVPPEVIAVSGMRKVDLGYDKVFLNHLSQLDSHFLVSKKPEEIAKAISRIAKSELVDKIRTSLNSDMQSNTIKYNKTMSDIGDLNNDIIKFDYLPEYLILIDAVEASLNRIDELNEIAKKASYINDKILPLAKSRTSILSTIELAADFETMNILIDRAKETKLSLAVPKSQSSRLEDLEDRRSVFSEKLSKLPNTEGITEKLADSESQKRLASQLEDIKKKIGIIHANKEASSKKVDELSEIDTSRVVKLLEESEVLLRSAQDSKLSDIRLSRTSSARNTHNKALIEKEESLKTTSLSLIANLEELGVCPFCNSEIDAEKASK